MPEIIGTPSGMTIPEGVEEMLEKLCQSGFEAYLVGGCVRDWLLGKTPADYDVTTNAQTSQMKDVFRGYRVIETGIQHGTLTVMAGDMPVEITTYRVDGAYTDGRHPDSVSFSACLEEDLSRRDFTVNAMAYSPRGGFVDMFGGAEDLRRGLIRCVGEPDRRFGEDALRILRALRFASVLGFAVEDETAASIHRNRELLQKIARERVTDELLRLLCGNGAEDILRAFADVAVCVLPPVGRMIGLAQHHPCHIYDVWEHTLRVVAHVPCDKVLRLAALLHDVGKPYCRTIDEKGIGHFYGHAAIGEQIGQEIFRQYLRLDHAAAGQVLELIKHHDEPIEPTRKMLRRRLMKYGEQTLRRLLILHRADVMGQNPALWEDRLRSIDEAEALLDALLAEGVCLTLHDLRINGRDLQALGIAPGPMIGQIMQALLREVCDEKTANEHEALRRRAWAMYERFQPIKDEKRI